MITYRQQQQAQALRRRGWKLSAIAAACGITWHQAQRACRAIVPPDPYAQLRARARALAADRVYHRTIATLLGVPLGTVHRWCYRLGAGAEEEARRLRARGLSVREIAARVGRSVSMVRIYLREETR